MLHDRDYMRGTPSHSREFQWNATTILIVVTCFAFIFQNMFRGQDARRLQELFFLSPEGFKHGFLWQLLTFQFFHGGIGHLAFNMLGIYFIGRELENALGRGAFLKLYFGSGVAGGLVQVLLGLAVPSYFGGSVIGASAGVCGLVAAFSALHWNRPLNLIFLVFPVTMTGKMLLFVSVLVSVLGGLLAGGFSGDKVAHAAHLGGFITGLYYVFGIMHGNPWGSWSNFGEQARPRRELVRAATAREAAWQRPKVAVEEDLPPAEFISKEVDPILDKISAHGIHSLTDRERKILERARAKMTKR